jgi:hypothetical protein
MADENDKKKLDEKFEASFGVNASISDPIEVGSNKRPADKTEGDKAMPKLPKAGMIADMVTKAYKLSGAQLAPGYAAFLAAMEGGTATADANRATLKTYKEDVDSLFEGSDLSEDFKNGAATLFENAVDAKVAVIKAQIEEENEKTVAEAVEAAVSTIEENTEKYLDYIAGQWIAENKVAIETGIRADILENFLGGMKALFLEHFIDIPEDKVDVVEQLTAQVQDLTSKLNESENAVIEKDKAIQEMQQGAVTAAIVAEAIVGLTDTQAEKVKTLAESLEFVSESDFREKLVSLTEGLVTKSPTTSATEQLNEAVDLDDAKTTTTPTSTDPVVAAVLGHIASKSSKN